jgi:phage terminase large subunit
MRIEIKLQPKQREAFDKSMETPITFFGGARGGGKSFLIRAREVYRRLKYPGTKGLIVRKTYPELLSNHIRMFFVEYPETSHWFHRGEKAIFWPNGSITEFSYMKTTDDVYTYQGREYEDISIDEVTQHEEEVVKILRASNRTTKSDIKPTMLLTGNPGGVGHGWIKRLFIDRKLEEGEHPGDYAFIQSKVYDNQALMKADPDYIKRLQALPEDRRRAWLEGDWDVFSGQIFSEFRRERHVISPLIPSRNFEHIVGMDWGYSEKAAFACYVTAIVPMKAENGETFNRIVTYQEWYGNLKYPDEWAGIIWKTAKIRTIKRGWADASMFNPQSDGSVPISRLFDRVWKKKNRGERWIFLDKGSRNTIARVATLHNWLSLAPDGIPYWLITADCVNLIRTLPQLVYDEGVEKVETHQEDHCFDAVGYSLTQIKWVPSGGFGSAITGVKAKAVVKARPIIQVNDEGLPLGINPDDFIVGHNRRQRDWRAV